MENLNQLIKNHVTNEIIQWSIENRQMMHAHPELSKKEQWTSNFIANKLTEIGLDFETNIGGYGVVATLKCKNPDSKIIALRADMDALPIHEENKVSYVSGNPGVMHACGHDVHSSIILGAAKTLFEMKKELTGTIKFIFQPSEEEIPSGAPMMIDAGVLDDVSTIFGLHVSPEINVGQFGFHSGQFMASCDEIHLTVNGKGGHAARVNETINPILVASEIMLKLFAKTDMNIPQVVNFGEIIAKGNTNVVPNFSKIKGTIRTFSEIDREEIKNFIRQEIFKICNRSGATCEVNIKEGYPVLINDESITDELKKLAGEYFGNDAIIEAPIRMGAEDFAFYSQKIPATFIRLGVGNPKKGITSGIHTPTFDVDKDCIKFGIELACLFALNQLN